MGIHRKDAEGPEDAPRYLRDALRHFSVFCVSAVNHEEYQPLN
jgi:hypothetical protein